MLVASAAGSIDMHSVRNANEFETYLALAQICLHQRPELLQREVVPAAREQRHQVLQTLDQVQRVDLRNVPSPRVEFNGPHISFHSTARRLALLLIRQTRDQRGCGIRCTISCNQQDWQNAACADRFLRSWQRRRRRTD